LQARLGFGKTTNGFHSLRARKLAKGKIMPSTATATAPHATAATTPSWTGGPATLTAASPTVNMPSTAVGSMVLAYQNLTKDNNLGQLTITSGGSAPNNLPVDANANQPDIYIQNWQGSNLTATNTSTAISSTPIWIEAVGPGLPGQHPLSLGPTAVTIPAATPGQVVPCATGQGQAKYMNLVMTANSGQQTIVVLIGGPQDASGNNAYVFGLNFASSVAPAGYAGVSTTNSYTYQFNWGSSSIFLANVSSSTTAGVAVTLTAL
jgi:hypothetical protein